MPVIEVRQPDPTEFEGAPISMPATLAGVAYELPALDQARGSGGLEYANLTIVNGSTTIVTGRDANGRSLPVQSGQPIDWDLPAGTKYLSVTPTADVAAGLVVLLPRLRRVAHG